MVLAANWNVRCPRCIIPSVANQFPSAAIISSANQIQVVSKKQKA